MSTISKQTLATLVAGSLSIVMAPSAAHASAGRPVAGAATPDRLKLPSGPSSVRGLADEPSVDAFAAQLNYQVPIELPGGFGGLAPKLALTYSGALGNGPLGIGWTLAQPKIQRSTRLGVPRFDDTDELELSGIASGRLISIGNGEYRVEGMGQTIRVVRVGAGFELDDGSGVHYRLGSAPASRQESDASHTLAWLVDQQTNTMGEQIQYSYAHDQNQAYLTQLTWGPAGAFSATLGYEARADQTRSYRGGFAVVTARRLATIRVSAFGTERRAYQLAYDATFPVARLAGVHSTGVAGAGAWPALAFTYAAPGAAAITPIAGIGSWRLNTNGATLVDLDGDGAAELLQLAAGGHSYLTNRNGTFSGLQPMTGNTQAITAVQLQDVDGDARAELLQDSVDGWLVFKFSRTQWIQQPGIWPGTAGLALKQPTTTRFADLNGDGLVDVLQWDNDNLKVHLATPTGIAPAQLAPRIGGAVLPTSLGRFQDANGDGLDDYLVTASDHLDVYLGHGDGTFDPATRVAYPFAGSIASPQDLELADLDRDGLIDLLRINSGTVAWYRGQADGSFATTAVTLANPEPLASSVVVAVADTNGNGSQDVVWSSASGMWRMDLAGTTTAGMLIKVDNGLGMATTLDYESSHSLAIAAQDAGNPWASNVPIAIPVPVHQTTALGAGETTRAVSFGVRDGFWDAIEHRFGGFLTTTVTTAAATAAETSTVMTRYNAGTGVNRVLRGKPMTTQVFDGTGRRLSITVNTWEAMAVAGLPTVPLLRRAVLRDAHGRHEDVTPVRETEVAYSYDALGRASHIVDSGRLDLTGDESVEDRTYGDDDTTWVRDRLCETKISSTAGEVASDVEHLFGDNATVLPHCVIGKGWPRVTQGWLASEARFVPSEQTAYDAHGNPISVTTAGVTHSYVYDATGLFPSEEHQAAPGHDLVWRASWNTVLGVATAITDPNGHVSHLSYDSLGRYTGVAIDNRAPHQIVEYDLTPPFPKTTTWDYDGALATVGVKPAAWSPTNHWRQTVEVANARGELRYKAQRLAASQWIISDYKERDPSSRVVFAGRPVYSAQLELTARPVGITGDQLAYDPLGRVISQTLPTGGVRTSSYVAFERTVSDPELAPVHSVLDGQGRAILTERALADGTHELVQASYDPAGRLTRMTLAGGQVVRTFSYDTLGRLTQSSDPDLGVRTLRWDDGGRLTEEDNAAGQAIRYSYDALGRLATRDAGGIYRYHYDAARAGAGASVTNPLGRLASIDEPTGGLDLGYDELGHPTFTRHRIDSRTAEETTGFTASGLVLSRGYDDGFAVPYSYDPAGRVIGAGDLWQLVDQDASGAALHELAHNGADTRTVRDAAGLASQVTVRDVAGAAIYDVTATRNPWTGITALTDHDGAGLDHGAQFRYDGFARLTGATTAGFTFGYGYDVLHNMTSRSVAGPSTIAGLFAGTYHYAEAGHAPRQLTSITGAAGAPVHTFNYDAAGRQIAKDGLTLTFDPADRLTRVDGIAGGAVLHSYGHAGDRIKTVEPGATSYLFSAHDTERNGVREHDVVVGSHVVARITMAPAAVAGTGAALGGVALGRGGLALAGLVLVVAGASLRRRGGRRLRAAGMTGVLAATACAPLSLGERVEDVATIQRTTFLHGGFGAGPVVFTDDTGHLLEERRYEPFGAPIDARVKTASGYTTGAPDLVDRDLNPMNQRTDVATGWSDHGARWLAPETGRWLTPDPPVAGPSAKLMFAPWGLNPYQYVAQNPISYWDPDGREAHVDSSTHVIASTTVDLVLFTTTVTIDLNNGDRYVSYGVTTPCADVVFTGGVVHPYPGNTVEDVITGFSAGVTVATPVVGTAMTASANPSGYILSVGGGFGIDGISASMTYTSKDEGFLQTIVKEQAKLYERSHPTPTRTPAADLSIAEPTSMRVSGSAQEDRVYGPMPAPSRAPAHATSSHVEQAAKAVEPQACWTTGAPP